jgi:hypothetical protein
MANRVAGTRCIDCTSGDTHSAAEVKPRARAGAHWPERGGARIFGAHPVHLSRSKLMFTLFWHACVFLLLTFVVYLVCMWMAGVEERRTQQRAQRNR